MGKLFVLCGRSGTGKDTIFSKILNDKEINIETIVPYTTRPKRSNEIDGKEYHFVDNITEDIGYIIEKRVYNTQDGIWTYATVDDGINLDNKSYININTIEGTQKLIEYFGKDKVIPILLEVNSIELFERLYNREDSLDNPKWKEMCRRWINDNKDYGMLEQRPEYFENIDYIRLYNYNVDSTFFAIKGLINQFQ